MAAEYATATGEPPAVAQALYEAELPRHAGDQTPTTPAGAILSLAERLGYLAGLATTFGLPTGSSDPSPRSLNSANKPSPGSICPPNGSRLQVKRSPLPQASPTSKIVGCSTAVATASSARATNRRRHACSSGGGRLGSPDG